MTVAIHDIQRRAGDPAGSFASRPGRAIVVAMTATLTSPTFVGRTEELSDTVWQVLKVNAPVEHPE